MSTITKTTCAGIIALIALALLMNFTAIKAHANPSEFRNVNNLATTTNNSIAFGTGTTTYTYDSGKGAEELGADSATLVMQYLASTTAPQLAIRIEHSRDNIDWYPETVMTTIASTTATSFVEQIITFGTSTASTKGYLGSGSFLASTTAPSYSRVHQSIPITTTTRYTRAIIYGISGNGSFWGDIVAKKQIR